jgi:hypothetical protein
MKKWLGAKEEYYFSSTADGGTKLDIKIEADEAFEPMMQAWDQALKFFKVICEE